MFYKDEVGVTGKLSLFLTVSVQKVEGSIPGQANPTYVGNGSLPLRCNVWFSVEKITGFLGLLFPGNDCLHNALRNVSVANRDIISTDVKDRKPQKNLYKNMQSENVEARTGDNVCCIHSVALMEFCVAVSWN